MAVVKSLSINPSKPKRVENVEIKDAGGVGSKQGYAQLA
jgi:hypothetical protein